MKSLAWKFTLAVVCSALLHPSAIQAQNCIDYGDHIHHVGGIDTPGYASGVRLMDDLGYVADGQSGLQIIDVSDSTTINIIGSVALQDEMYAQSTAVAGTYAYTVGGTDDGWSAFGTFQTIQISDPTSPEVIATLEIESAFDIALHGDHALVATSGGLQIVRDRDHSPDVAVGQGC